MRRKSLISLVLVALMLSPWPLAPAVKGQAQAARSRATTSARPKGSNHLSAFADFDSDLEPDQAELHASGAHKRIRVRFGNARETQLTFEASPFAQGALLATDVNQDHNRDLIWIPDSRSESARVWLGDGLGNFERAEVSAIEESQLRELLSDGADPGIAGGSLDPDLVYTSPAPFFFNLSSTTKSEAETSALPVARGNDARRDLGLTLAYLRERGPPTNLI